MFDSKNYGCEVAIVCYYLADNLYGTYSGFAVLRIDSGEEIARFYEGDPVEDYDAAISYAQSITRHIERSPGVDQFWKKLGIKPRGVRRDG